MTASGEQVVPAATSVRYRMRARTFLSLVAGRSSFRLAQLGATVILLPVWGERRYGVYAAAVAAFTWLIPLLQSGPEKTVLKLLPRAPRTGPEIVEALVWFLWCLLIAAPAALVVALASGERGRTAIYVGVAGVAAGSGATLLLAGLHRVTGRPWLDARSGFALAILQVSLVGFAIAGLRPLGYVVCFMGGQTTVNLVLLVKLGRPSLRIRHRPAFLRRVLWTVVLMGLPEVGLYLATSVVFAIMAASHWSFQVGQLFVVLIVWTAGLTLVMYALRVYAPLASIRLLGRAGAAGRFRAAQLCRWIVATDMLWGLAFACIVWRFDVLAITRTNHALWVWSVLYMTRTPGVLLTILSGYLVENSDARSIRITGTAAGISLAVTASAGVLFIPAFGGLGMFGALVLAEMAGAGATIFMIGRHRRLSTIQGSGRYRREVPTVTVD